MAKKQDSKSNIRNLQGKTRQNVQSDKRAK